MCIILFSVILCFVFRVSICCPDTTYYRKYSKPISHLASTPTISYMEYVFVNLSHQSLENLDGLVSWLLATDLGNRIFKLDISHNNLSTISTNVLRLLPGLNILNVSHNHINNLDNDLFINNTCLQILDISYNIIEYLPSGLLGKKGELYNIIHFHASHNKISDMGLDLFHEGHVFLKTVDVSYNQLQYFEPWPYRIRSSNEYIHAKGYKFDLSHNIISYFRNRMKYFLSIEQSFTVCIEYNNLTRVRVEDFKMYFPPGNEFTAYNFIILRMQFQNNPWMCDCKLYPLVSLAADSFLLSNKEATHSLYCFNPPELRHKSFGYLMINQESLICNITTDCPDDCLCQDHPAEYQMIVDCSGVNNYTKMPETVPKHSNTSINMSGNNIKYLGLTSYSENIITLNISYNKLTHIDPKIFHISKKLRLLDIRYNLLTILPKSIQQMTLSNIRLENNPLDCSCDTLWLNDWIRLNSDKNNLTCQVRGSIQLINSVTYHSIQCYTQIVLIVCSMLGCFIVLLLIITFISCKWKYESKVICYYLFRIQIFPKRIDVHLECLPRNFDYDIFISSSFKHDKIRKLAKSVLDRLEKLGFRTYFPTRDDPVGESKTDVMVEKMAVSKIILVVLDETYLNDGWCIEEFDHAHQLISEGTDRKIVLLVCDNELVCDDIQQEPLKTYISHKYYISYEDNLCWAKLLFELAGT